ncbi:hypothetical protein CYMTET_46858 [Cymbomonas tetramitiformis]|uniref:Sulfotransferase n=1 Tax=Cymbomonas tetramitiformis TaxID=36881 RepID=A0AAE0EYA2_9CHLO|nr:hypothetical protein CYMTET_46858 [Cymbomonas tetramitiformis]|eukprot:gene12004-14183_t
MLLPEVIGAGFGRTGTSSLRAALEVLLEAPCYHMSEVSVQDSILSPSLLEKDILGGDASNRTYRHSEAWLAIARGQNVDLRALFSGYRATVDFPAACFYSKLLAEFPNAKVILSKRSSAKAWYKSAYDTINWTQRGWARWVRSAVLSRRRLHHAMVRACIWDRLFGGEFSDESRACEVYEEWLKEVEATVPADRLLIYEVSSGWGPLCKFLGQPIPDVPFPHVNDSEFFHTVISRAHKKMFLFEVLAPLAPLIGAAGIGLFARLKRR